MKALDVRIILSQEILKIEPTNFGPFWTENRLLSQCVRFAIFAADIIRVQGLAVKVSTTVDT